MNSTWCENIPESLVDISARFCARNLFNISESQRLEDADISNLGLPHEIGEKLFMMACEEHMGVSDRLVEVFRHQRITRARLRGCSLSDRGVNMVLRHRLRELDIHNCAQFTVSHHLPRLSCK